MSDEYGVGIDFSALIDELKNQTAKNLILSFITEDSAKETMKQILDVFYRHGIDAMTTMDIMQELIKVLPQKQEGEDGKDIAFH